MERKFKLCSDHKSLQYLPTFEKPIEILARWFLKIQDLDYEFEYPKGKHAIRLENESEEVNAIKPKYYPKKK